MKFEELLPNTKWDILAAVAEGATTATAIAKATGTSLANISQQTQLLEAWGLLTFGKEGSGVGKPQRRYALKRELAFLAVVQQGSAEKRTLSLDAVQRAAVNILLYPKRDDQYFLFKFLWQQEAYVRQCDAIAVVESKEKELHLLVLAPPERLETLRKEYSKVVVHEADGKRGKTLISWAHSSEEIAAGLEKGEPYFTNLLKHPHTIFDTKRLIATLQKR